MGFTKAVKSKQRLRLAIDGVSGSGKTFTALAISQGMAKAIGGKIALIDSEHGSASLYADRFEFDTQELMEFQIEDYVSALNEAAKAGYDIVIIDSTSHAWNALVERVERIATQRYNGNSFRAWAEGTPLQEKLVEAMLTYPGHVIVTCRSKTEYSIDKDDKGKTTVTKLGTAAVQRQGFEYEFTMAMSIDKNHVGAVTKDRTGKFQDKFIERPGEEFGMQLIEWLNEGAAPLPPAKTREQMLAEYTSAKTELLNILASKAPDDSPLFTEAEHQVTTLAISGLKGKTANECLDTINRLLVEKKAELKDRLEKSAAAKPAPAGAKASKPKAAKEDKSLSAQFKKHMAERGKEQAPETATAAPSMYSEPEEDPGDGFEDDIPEPAQESAPASAELDIF